LTRPVVASSSSSSYTTHVKYNSAAAVLTLYHIYYYFYRLETTIYNGAASTTTTDGDGFMSRGPIWRTFVRSLSLLLLLLLLLYIYIYIYRVKCIIIIQYAFFFLSPSSSSFPHQPSDRTRKVAWTTTRRPMDTTDLYTMYLSRCRYSPQSGILSNNNVDVMGIVIIIYAVLSDKFTKRGATTRSYVITIHALSCHRGAYYRVHDIYIYIVQRYCTGAGVQCAWNFYCRPVRTPLKRR